MEKLKSITIEKNEKYLRQISKKVKFDDPELYNNIVVLQDYCMQNDVMAMAGVQLGIPKRIIYVKNTNLDILNKRLTDSGKEETKDYNEATVLCHEIDHLDGILHIDIADEVLEMTKEERIDLRKKEGYTIIRKDGEYEEYLTEK